MEDLLAKLFEAAKAAQTNAYAKYSNFKVGASLLADDGKIYAGANVENASYPEGQCAETSAIGAMVTGGGRHIKEMMIVAPILCTPCGGCRQRMREFADENVLVHVARADGPQRTFRLGDLLPVSFSMEHLSEPGDQLKTSPSVEKKSLEAPRRSTF